MNKRILLGCLLDNVDQRIDMMLQSETGDGEQAASGHDPILFTEDQLEELYAHLVRRREQDEDDVIITAVPKDPEAAEAKLREHFDGDVTITSLLLHINFPDKYLYYRVGDVQQELFKGFDFFAEVDQRLAFGFDHVPKNGFERYLQMNAAFLGFGREVWPDVSNLQTRMTLFLFDGLARLFLELSDYNRYWINSTSHDLADYGKNVDWSGRKEMQRDDLVFMYQTAPVKGITNLYRVESDAYFDPFFPWGVRVPLEQLCTIPKIPFSDLRQDKTLGAWSVIRRQFQGVVTEPVSHSCFNRLLEYLPSSVIDELELTPEPLSQDSVSGTFASEEEFEDEVIVPLLKRLGFHFNRQQPCKCYFGTQRINGYVDFLVSNERGPLTLFENKLKIVNDKQRNSAVEQAKSYALMLGLPSFVVGSPDGLWLYSLTRNREKLALEWKAGETNEEFRSELLRLQTT